MNDFGSERSKAWNIYTSSDTTPSQSQTIDREAPWKNFGTSMNAIAFGFVATAILISMFLIMAIFEHLFRPNPSFSSPQTTNRRRGELGSVDKLGNPQTVGRSYASSDYSVVMPGQKYPTYIAQPAPLPCPREGILWPNHRQHNNLVFP
ncbi:uncharacterized protein [Euphorbia lathyris]|uniref:uncharacterized protein n=1 Tax=Euphorbia lathyris TaxID=212925 RepID=UPI003313D39E